MTNDNPETNELLKKIVERLDAIIAELSEGQAYKQISEQLRLIDNNLSDIYGKL